MDFQKILTREAKIVEYYSGLLREGLEPLRIQQEGDAAMNTQARIGLIIPSGNRMTEPQFNQYAPPGTGIYVTRLRMTGQWRKPPGELKKSLTEAAEVLSDTKPDVIVFHCTA